MNWFRTLSFLGLIGVLFCGTLAVSYGKSPTLRTGQMIRDAEVEATLRSYIDPLFKTAGLDKDSLHLFLVVNPEVNAAAGLQSSIFINTGLIQKSTSVGQLIGVLAHETGHIAGGHILRNYGVAKKTALTTIASFLLGAAVGVAAKNSDAGIAVFALGSELGTRSYLHYTRGQEASADQAAAKFLEKLQWSSQGLLEFMKTFEQQELLSSEHQSPYLRTHPLTKERISFFKTFTQEKSKFTETLYPPEFISQFQRMKVKLDAFLTPPGQILYRYSSQDTSLENRYGRAIALYRNNQISEALTVLEGLIQEFPQDPYFHELKGQILFESGRAQEALPSYQQAVKLSPKDTLLRLLYARVLLEQNTVEGTDQAFKELNKVRLREQTEPLLWRSLAEVYGRRKEEGRASLMLAELALLEGHIDRAKKQAERALRLLPADAKKEKIQAQELLKDIEAAAEEEGSERSEGG